MTLYEINQNIESALERMFTEVDEETGEVKDELVTELAELNIARDEKLEAIGCYIKNLQAEAAAILEESKQLKARFEQKAKRVEYLKNMLTEDLLEHGEMKKEFTKVAYSFRKSKQVVITDEDSIPPMYIKAKVEMVPDKTAIKKAIEGGETVTGAQVVENQNIQIK